MLVETRPNGSPTRPPAGDFIHQALIYESEQDFVDAALPFVRAGIEAGEAVLARVRAPNARALRSALGDDAARADIEPADDFYENPSRTRAKFLRWAGEHCDGHRARMLGEPPWPLDSEAGVRDWARHESVINLAFEGRPVTFACPYDAAALPPRIIEHAEATHPSILRSAGTNDSPAYADPHTFCGLLDEEIVLRRGRPQVEVAFGIDDLRAVRRLVEQRSAEAGMGGERLIDLTLAVDEIASNALRHGRPPTVLRLWREPGELIWEISDGGAGISDPLVGQIAPDPLGAGGRGIWTARMVCDWLEFRTDRGGTIVALHTSLPQS